MIRRAFAFLSRHYWVFFGFILGVAFGLLLGK